MDQPIPLTADSIASITKLTPIIRDAHKIFDEAIKHLANLPPDLREGLKASVASEVAPESVISILGASGSGKSTLFNAILGPCGILPQGSSGQACTAVPLEIRGYQNRKYAYKVEIIYATEDEFLGDIAAAQNAMTASSESREHELSQVSKLEAIFPSIPKDQLKGMFPNELLNHESVRDLVGAAEKFRCIEFSDCRDWLRERVVAKFRQQTAAKWALAKVARIYVKSPFFEHGLVLTDVPGSGDSNHARNIRSKFNSPHCVATLVVAPASRGGSNACLGSMIRDVLQDLRSDGRLDKVVLVSTMSDAVSIDELEQDLGGGKKTKHDQRQLALKNEIESVKARLETANTKLHHARECFRTGDLDLKRWKLYEKALSKNPEAKQPRKRIGNSKNFCESDSKRMRPKQVQVKIQQFEAQIQVSLSIREKYELRAAKLQDELNELRYVRKLEKQNWNKGLIAMRNENLRDSQLDIYLDEIRVIETEIAEAASEEDNRLLTDSTRDYDQLRASLPVFCTSARSFQHMTNYAKAEPQYKICQDEFDTGIPQLRDHLINVGIRAREEKIRTLHNDAMLKLSELNLVVMQKVEVRDIDPEKASIALEKATHLVNTLQDDFIGCIKKMCKDLMSSFNQSFQDNIPKIKKGSRTLVQREMMQWIEKPRTSVNGLYSPEYRCAVRRGGEWCGSRVTIDFNDRIRRQVQNAAQVYIDATFTSRDSIFINTVNNSFSKLEQFCKVLHTTIRPFLIAAGVPPLATNELDDQVKLRTEKLRTLAMGLKRDLSSIPAKAIEDLADDVKLALTQGYIEATNARTSRDSGWDTLLKAMSNTLMDYIEQKKPLIDPIRGWEKRMNDAVLERNRVTQELIQQFVKSLVGAYKQAMTRKQNSISSAGDPVQDMIRNQIIASRLLPDEAVGIVKEEHEDVEMPDAEGAEENEDDGEMANVADKDLNGDTEPNIKEEFTETGMEMSSN